MQIKRRKCRNGEWMAIFWCPKRGCQTTRSARAGSRFFHFTDLNQCCNSGLTLCQIVELIFMFVLELPTQMVIDWTGRSKECVTDWFNMCREVCTAVLKTKNKLVGNAQNPIQIDEAHFAGRRKYNRGRLLARDAPPSLTDIIAEVINNRNYGARVDGPWVFGLKNGNDCRYFYIHQHDRETLLPIIERECEAGSEIHSDEWAAYRCLTSRGFIHKTVNHQMSYVDANTGAHTQNIERSWLDAKIKLLKKMRGVPLHHLQSHLDHYCWRLYHQDGPNLFLVMLVDIMNNVNESQ